MKKYDALIVLSGGIRGESELTPWTKNRVDLAKELDSSSKYVIFATGNTPHVPPLLDSRGFPITEARAMSNYYLKNGGAREKSLLEERSTDTIGNAYFTRVIHTDLIKLKKLGIITSKFHMPRTKEIFRTLFGFQPLPFSYDLDFLDVENVGIDDLNVREKKEASSLENFILNMQNVKSLAEFHKWINTKHKSYSTGLKDNVLQGEVLKTYK